MSTNWKVGDKAVCVEDCVGRPAHPSFVPGFHPNGLPVKGTTYLVTSVNAETHILGLRLSGYPAISVVTGNDLGWAAYKFRKVVTATERAEQERTQLMPHAGFWQSREDLK